jgi:beta-glucosidase
MYDLFQLPPIRFPAGFLWGSSTAGHQIEGDNINAQQWHAEQRGDFWVKDPAINAVSGKACDHLRLWREDVDLIADLGHQAYRMSLEWSRIEPREGHWDEAAIEFYVALLERLNERGVQPFVTLCHITYPQWFAELGGFGKPENLRFFERYIERVVPRIAHLVYGWNVLNEFNGGRSADAGPYKFQLTRVHARGYHLIKQHSRAPVSTAHAFIHWMPRRYHDPLDRMMTELVDFCTNEFFFHAIRTGELVYPYTEAEYDPEVKGAIDYWAVNSYTRHMVDARSASAEGSRFAHKRLRLIPVNGFYLEEFYPEGLIANLERLKDRPVYITENGCAATDDRWRITYIALHLAALTEAIERGVDLRGYFYWSTMDNYEWYSFAPRFGLVHVDFATFVRTPKPSAHFFRSIIERNGFDQDLIRAYVDALPTEQSPSGPQYQRV